MKKLIRPVSCQAGVFCVLVGLAAVCAPDVVMSQIHVGRACFTALPGGPNRAAACVPPAVTCDPVTYYCGFWTGTGNSRDTFTEMNYRYCGDIPNPAADCDISWSDATCMIFKVYKNLGCTAFLCNGETTFDDCYTSF